MEITQDTIVIIKGKKLDMEQFAERFAIESVEKAIPVAQILHTQGRLTIYEKTTNEDDILKVAMEQNKAEEIAKMLEEQELDAKVFKREQKAEDSDLVGIGLTFPNSIEASNAEAWINEVLHIQDTEISIKRGEILLKVRNITPEEHTKIARKYNLDLNVKKVIGVTKKGCDTITNGFNYAATEILTPLGVVSEEVTWAIGKTLVSTIAKAGAGFINTGAKAYRDTKVALTTDPELIKAQGQLLIAKNNGMRMLSERANKTGSSKGIRILED